jgi:hypothetical protein
LGDVSSRWVSLSLPEVVALTLLAYRSQYHTVLRDTPAKTLYGLDILFPPERLIYSAMYDLNKERVHFLNSLRAKLIEDMKEVAERALYKANKARTPAELTLHQLVLVRKQEHNKMGGAWTLPQRVICVLSQGKAALVQDLLNGKVANVHLEDTRPLPPPQQDVQLAEWYHLYWAAGYDKSLEEFKTLLAKPPDPRTFPTAPTHDPEPPPPPRYQRTHTLPRQPLADPKGPAVHDPESSDDEIFVDLDQVYVDSRPRSRHYRLTANGLLPLKRKVYWADELLPNQPPGC